MQRQYRSLLSPCAALLFAAVVQLSWVLPGPAVAATCIRPGNRATCTRDDQCCSGAVCAGVCRSGCKIETRVSQNGTIRISKAFYANGTINPDNDCQWCQAAANRFGWTNRTSGVSCGSPSQTSCDNPDTCNGSGTCLPNHVADDTTCGTPGQCEVQDTCSNGVCRDNGFKPASAPCGDQATGPCDGADRCSGSDNACLPNHVADGTDCGTPGQCEVQDTCSNGACQDSGYKSASAPCGDQATGPCDGADRCSGTDNTCLPNHLADGTNCGTPGQCEGQDTCLNGACDDKGFESSATICRAKAGDCDVAEHCPGNGPDCPADTVAAGDTLCGGGLCNGQSPLCCDQTCTPGSCGYFPNGCGGQKDCGLCLECVVPANSARACAAGLEATGPNNNICRGPSGSYLCTRDEQCASGTCECFDPALSGCDTSGLAVTATWPGTGCLHDLGDGTIGDSCRGAQWEKKTTTAGLHDVNAVYSWAGCCDASCQTLCQPNAAAAATCMAQAAGGTEGCGLCGSGTCNVDPYRFGASTTVWDWLTQVNAANFAGHSDWRLPKELYDRELVSTLAPLPCSTPPCIDPVFGPSQAYAYWAADSEPGCLRQAADQAKAVDFSNGGVVTVAGGPVSLAKSVAVAARAVRSIGVCRSDGASCAQDAHCATACDTAGGRCRNEIGGSCTQDADCVFTARCANNTCVANYPIGWPCTSNLARDPAGTSALCRQDTGQCAGLLSCYADLGAATGDPPHASTECASGWCLKTRASSPTGGPLSVGNPVCCRELDEACADDAECCAGGFCTDNSAVPLRVRRCLDDGTGTKRCQKIRLLGEPCDTVTECATAAHPDVQCTALCTAGAIGAPCNGNSVCDTAPSKGDGTCGATAKCFSPSVPPASNPGLYYRREGQTCYDDDSQTAFDCEPGTTCTDCTGFDRATGAKDPAKDGTGWRCLSTDASVRCCSMWGPDVLGECGDKNSCCNGRCTDTRTDTQNCGVCGADCSTIPPQLLGGDVCWTTGNGTCTAGQCDWQRKCGPGQVCEASGSVALCYTPVTLAPVVISASGSPTLSLFDFAQQLGSFDNLFVTPDTHLACDSPRECLSTQICYKDCAFELKATTGGGGIGFGLGFPGSNTACTSPGVCQP